MCVNYKKKRAYMSGFGETKKQAWQNVDARCCLDVVSCTPQKSGNFHDKNFSSIFLFSAIIC